MTKAEKVQMLKAMLDVLKEIHGDLVYAFEVGENDEADSAMMDVREAMGKLKSVAEELTEKPRRAYRSRTADMAAAHAELNGYEGCIHDALAEALPDFYAKQGFEGVKVVRTRRQRRIS